MPTAETGRVCSASGSLNYRTFDGAMFNYGGTCKYLLAGVAHGKARNGLPAWRVLAHNQRLVGRGRRHRAYTKYVQVEVDKYIVTLDSDKRVLVSGVDIIVDVVVFVAVIGVVFVVVVIGFARDVDVECIVVAIVCRVVICIVIVIFVIGNAVVFVGNVVIIVVFIILFSVYNTLNIDYRFSNHLGGNR